MTPDTSPSPPLLIDTHAHLDEEAFDADRDEVVARAAAAGICRIVTIGTTADTSRRAVEVAARYPAVYAAVGIQPNYAAQAKAGDWEADRRPRSRSPKSSPSAKRGSTAIGTTPRSTCRSIISSGTSGWRRGSISRSSSIAAMPKPTTSPNCVGRRPRPARGSDALVHRQPRNRAGLSRIGALHFVRRHADLQEVAGPARAGEGNSRCDRIVVETDSPYLAPQPMRGKRNEPSFVRVTANALAELVGMSQDEFARQTTANACRLFGLSLDDKSAATRP